MAQPTSAAWMDEQHQAALVHTARLAASLAAGSGGALVPGPRGPWSTLLLGSVAPTEPRRECCAHLLRPRPSHIPMGPRPLVVPARYVLTCTTCAAERLSTSSTGRCHFCNVPRQLTPVVAHGRVVILVGVLCPRCLAAERGQV